MRILRLDFGPELGTVDLHPFVSVVHGLTPDQRDALADVVRSLVRGSDGGIGGLVEEDGTLIELPAPAGSFGPFTIEDVVLSVDGGAGDGADLPALRAERDQVRRQAEIDAVSVEVIRADLDPAALAKVQAVRDHMAGIVPVSEAKLQQERFLHAVKQALIAAKEYDPVIREARKEVAPVIERWATYREALEAATPHLNHLSNAIDNAEANHEAALAKLAEAESKAVPVVLTSEEDRRVVELSTADIDGGKARRRKARSSQEEEELAALLAKVGQSTYPAYAMYRMAPQPSPENVALVAQAKEQVEQTRVSLEESRTEFSIDPAAIDLNFQFDIIKDEARQHLGPMLPDDLGEALAALVDERQNPLWLEAIADLYDALSAAGVEISDELEPGDLIPFGQQWVDAEEEPTDDTGPSRVELEEQLEQAEAVLTRHARAMARIDQLEAAADASADRLAVLQQLIDQAEEGLGSDSSLLFDNIQPLSDRVQSEAGTSAPLVLQGEFVGLDDEELSELFDRYETLAPRMQLIILTDRTRALSWAREAGLRRALRTTLTASTV